MSHIIDRLLDRAAAEYARHGWVSVTTEAELAEQGYMLWSLYRDIQTIRSN